MRTFLFKALVVFIAALLCGCAAMQPHTKVPPDSSLIDQPVLAGGLNYQYARGRELQELYMDAVANQTLLTNRLATLLIPMSAGAVAVAIINPSAEATRDLLTATGAATATALGLGGFLVDRRRDAIYYNGVKAIYCLWYSIQPLAMDKEEYRRMLGDINVLERTLAVAAREGVATDLLEQGNNTYAIGQTLARDIAQSGAKFSNQLEMINLSVNAQIASNDRSISEINAAIAATQTNTTGIIKYLTPSGTTQGGKAKTPPPAEANLRQSIQEVNKWIKVYQNRVSKTDAELRACQCIPANAPSPSPAQQYVFITDGQSIAAIPGSGGAVGASPTVVSLQAPSPKVRANGSSALKDNSPGFQCLRNELGLKPQDATSPESVNFMRKVREFQEDRGYEVTGYLKKEQKKLLCPAQYGAPGNPTVQPPPPDNPTVQPNPPNPRE
jgi:hypothetical protein